MYRTKLPEQENSTFKITVQTDRAKQTAISFHCRKPKKKKRNEQRQSNLNVLYRCEKSLSETSGSSSGTKPRRIWAWLPCVRVSVTKFRSQENTNKPPKLKETQVHNLRNKRQPCNETLYGLLCAVWFNNVLFLCGCARNEHHHKFKQPEKAQ